MLGPCAGQQVPNYEQVEGSSTSPNRRAHRRCPGQLTEPLDPPGWAVGPPPAEVTARSDSGNDAGGAKRDQGMDRARQGADSCERQVPLGVI